ncbi:MAG TPA: hypothetical protein P5202_02945 [Methanomassiliicoccales archaeon]|nr:hypothetical protein [Methanomassiliicoccales archaeon]HPR97742.1 hypothetical protein [Methanomassiliicoccales archaeon]HSA35501.1 hypothetical protein [Methanomassiliicoccales archaeon]
MASKKEGTEEKKQETPSPSFSSGPMPQDAMVHLLKSGTEFLAAIDTLMPRSIMPPEAKVHYNNIRKETLLMFRSFIDSQLSDIDKKKEAPAPRLRKIDLD